MSEAWLTVQSEFFKSSCLKSESFVPTNHGSTWFCHLYYVRCSYTLKTEHLKHLTQLLLLNLAERSYSNEFSIYVEPLPFRCARKIFISSKLSLFWSWTSVIKTGYEYSGIPRLYCYLTSCTIQPLTFENSKIQRRRKMTSKSFEVKFWSDNLKIKRERFLKNTSPLGEKPKIETASVRLNRDT